MKKRERSTRLSMRMMAAVLAVPTALGQTTFKVVEGDWTNPANWTAGIPTSGVPVRIGASGYLVATAFIRPDNLCSAGSLSLGYGTAGADGTLILEGGRLDCTGDVCLPYTLGAKGTLVVSNGTLNAGGRTFWVGYMAGTALCRIVDGVITNCGLIYNGQYGNGTILLEGNGRLYGTGLRFAEQSVFVQNGGYVRIEGEVRMSTGFPVYFIMSNGTFETTGYWYGAYPVGSTATLVQVGGEIRGKQSHHVGYYGLATCILRGGIYTNVRMTVGSEAGSCGTLLVDGGNLWLDETLWAGYSGKGTVIVSNGTVTVPTISVGRSGNVTNAGRLEIHGGTVRCTGGTSYSLILGESVGWGEMWMTGGTLLLTNTAKTMSVGLVGGTCTVTIVGGTVSNAGPLTVGQAAAAVATVRLGGNVVFWQEANAVIGNNSRAYFAISNAVFDAKARVDIDDNASPSSVVELFGTQRMLRVGTVLDLGDTASITNHVARHAGGIDLLSTNAGALTIASGGKIHLAFEQDPVQVGDFWGLRWAGDRRAELRAFTNASPKKLTWDDTGLSPRYQGRVGIYTTATHTLVGFYVSEVPGATKGTLLMAH